MEEEIEELLKERYKNVEIVVYFIDFRIYDIYIKGLDPELKIKYIYDNNWTKNENLNSISEKIDNMILSHYHKF